MPIDRDKALNAPPSVREISWTTRDVLLYHLSLGAGSDPATGAQPHLTYERGLAVLPTFAMVAGRGVSSGELPGASWDMPGVDIDLRAILHAGQGLVVHRPLPAAGSATVSSRVAEVWDKGKAALIVRESTARDPGGEPLWTETMRIWARGEGGFSSEPGPEETWSAPDRGADLVVDTPTVPQQALLYRLNGDLNPLHADPRAARAAGFDRPILHGLASYGLVCAALAEGVLDGDVTRLASLSVRFAGVLFPGETLRTAVWREADRLLLRSTCPERDDAPVLTHATAVVNA
ncbi:MaoC/PaaZ C-terminal domain-containing protein [Streptomyces diacarni]|uniref:3-alpha,7-alpha, 12-alpha-trihydroxy-5-beta-cholest-24-enoyl-CoA hydratase n=1 Tax=Streptomyces diacarni TaxID=2800381 RepID=A0A367F4S7_9ACTN|nr:MaoC/PaaZ C-terminal domain-containing protein [Streptomyces diacarni]RCG24862.1 3-alpha,7-alpha,12-alpha-trihydroxy-5-beta-cholest-24-enoyl-CoA hydratase [Streptomyces diacarni]